MTSRVYTLEELLEARLIINAMGQDLLVMSTGINTDVLNSSEFRIEEGTKVKAILKYATKPPKAIEKEIYIKFKDNDKGTEN